jgi:hypothetical protein
MSVAKRRFLLTKLSVLRIVSATLLIPTTTVLVGESVVDRESVLKQAVTISVHRILSAIWINIVARRRVPFGEIIVLKVVWTKFAARTTTVELKMSAVFLKNVLIVVALDVLIIQTVIQPMSVAKKRFLWTKPFAQPIVSAKLVVLTKTVLVRESAVDRESVLKQVVTISVHLILSAIWINIVARRRFPIGEIVVLKVVLAKFAARTTTAELKTSAVFLTNVLTMVVRDVLQTHTAVADITVVRKDSGTN